MLPSPLGEGTTADQQRSSCVARCELSDEASFQTVTGCWETAAPPTASAEKLWCDDGGTMVCALLDACLADSFPMADVTAAVPLRFYLASAPPAILATAPDDSCQPMPDLGSPPAAPPVSCAGDDITIQMVAITLMQRTARALPALSCATAALAPLLIEGMKAGPVQPAVDVQATPAGGAATICRRFYGPRVVLAGGQTGMTLIPIPTSAALFEGGAACPPPSPAADGGAADQ
jgi:hypothetical protein